MRRCLVVALVAVLASCGGDPQPAPAPAPAPQPQPQPQPGPPGPPGPPGQPGGGGGGGGGGGDVPAPPPAPLSPATLDVLLEKRGPRAEIPNLDLNAIVAVVVYYDTNSPPPPANAQADSPAQERASPDAFGACDAGQGVWKPVTPISTRLTFDGDHEGFGVTRFTDGTQASRIEVHLIVTFGGLGTVDGSGNHRNVRVSACSREGKKFHVIRAGPAAVETKAGKNAKAAVVIESKNFAFRAPYLLLDFAALEAR